MIGVQERIEDLFGISENDFIYIPMTTFDKLYPNTERVYLLCSATRKETFYEAMIRLSMPSGAFAGFVPRTRTISAS